MSSQLRSDDRYLKHKLPRFSQGDILRDLEVVEWARVLGSESKEVDINKRLLPYAVVLSQECDLYQDSQNRADRAKPTQDKYVHSVLLIPAYPSLSVKAGTHLSLLGVICQQWGTDKWRTIIQNNNDRYHFLPAFDDLQVPEVVLDFKHFLTAPRDVLLDLRERTYVASLGQLFRDSLSQRFANFLARIALPDAAEEEQRAAGS